MNSSTRTPQRHIGFLTLLLLAWLGGSGLNRVQAQVAGYTFTNLAGTYSALTGGTAVTINSGGGTTDDGYSAPIALPFPFQFGANTFTTVTLSSNGYLGFGTHTFSTNYNVLRGAENNVVAFCNTNLLTGVGAAGYSYQTTGRAPSRVFKVQASEFQKLGNAGKTGNAQVWLYESNNAIEIHYGAFGTAWGVSPPIAVIPDTVRAGLRGSSIADLAAISGSWFTPTKVNSASAGLRMISASQLVPTPGQTFRFVPNLAPPVADFTASATAVSTADVVTLTDQSTNSPTAWQWTFAPTTVQFQNNTTATSQNPQVKFTATGCYTVTLTATNGNGSDGETKTSYICVTAPTCVTGLHTANCINTYIDAVKIVNTPLNNTGTGCSSTSGMGYTVYPASGSTTATLQGGQTYSLSVTSPALGAIAAWLDADGDGTFATTEFISVQQAGTPGPAPVPAVAAFTVPLNAPGGLVRLRVRNSATAGDYASDDACLRKRSGETEDYFVTIVAGCSLPKPTIVTNSPVCVGGTLTLSATGVPANVSYFWSGPNNFTSSSPTPSIASITSANGGSYQLVLVQGNCVSPRDVATVAVNFPPPAPGDITVGRCGPGSVTLTYTGSVTGVSYRWYTQPTGGTPLPGVSGPTYTTPSLPATTLYYVSAVSTVLGCESSRSIATARINTAPVATLTPVGSTTICAGDTVILRAKPRGRNANGAPLYTYAYQLNGQPLQITTDSLLVTMAGSYVVTVTEIGTSCSGTSAPVAVTVNPQASATFSYGARLLCQNNLPNPTPTISGTQGGTFTATPTGLSLNAQTGQITLASSQPGSYQITYTVGGPCPATATRFLTILAAPSAAFSYQTTGPLCTGSTNTLTPTMAPGATAGAFSATPTGLSLNAQTGEITLASSQPGTYTVTNTVVGGNICATTSATATVVIGATPTAAITASGPTVFCAGGSVTLTAGAGTSGLGFLWSTGATTPSITVTTGGQYSVTVTNASGCSATSQAVTVIVFLQPSAAFAYSAGSYCQSSTNNPTPTITGAPGGTFSATPAGLALNTQTGQIILGTSVPNTYAVTYTVGGRCPASQTHSVTITPAPAAAFSYPTTGTRCAGATGSITPTLAPGATAGTFTANTPGLSLNAATGVITLATSLPGPYLVTNTVAAANGCAATSATTSITLLPRPSTAVSADGPTTFCTGGSVVLSAPGGVTAALGYLWSTGATTQSITVNASGQYSVTVTNAAGCSATSQPITVTVLPQASAAFTYGAASFCLTGPNPTPTITGTPGGSFTAAPTGLAINTQTGQINLTNSQAGSYRITYSVGGQCPAAATRTVALTPGPSAEFGYSPDIQPCAGSQNTLPPFFGQGATSGTFTAAPAGLSLNAQTGVITLASSQAGTYTVTNTVAAGNGCAATSATASVTILAAPTPTISASGPTTFCAGGSVTLTASGGANASFLWNTGATTQGITVSTGGPYSVTVTNGAGCSGTSATTTVTVQPRPSAAFSYASSTFCLTGQNPTPTVTGTQGGTFAATPTGVSVSATTGQLFLGNSQPGTYVVTYTVGSQCPATASQTVTITTAPSAAFSYPANANRCVGSRGTLTPSFGQGASAGTFSATPSGLIMNASSGVIALANSLPGTYTVTNTIAAGNGCAASTATTTLTLEAAPTATITAGGPTTFCAGGSVTLTASGGTSYLWSTGATTASITVSTGGAYSVTATNAAGCSATSQATTVTVNPQASAGFSFRSATFCLTDTNPTPTVTGTPGGTWSANPSGLAINPQTGQINLGSSQAGTYTVTYAVAGSCPASQSTVITLTAPPSAAFSYLSNSSRCAGSPGSLTPTFGPGATAGAFSATPTGLILNATSGAISLTNSQSGTYAVTNTIGAANGCAAVSATATVTINARPNATIAADGPTTFCAGGSVTLTASGGTSYLWSTGATTSSIAVSTSGAYSVTATNAAGCSATSPATTVTVNPQASATFAYATSTYCVSGADPTPTISGSAGGSFAAAPSGLALNAQTGQIDLGSSQPGTYRITYAVAGTCPASTTQTLTITTAPAAAFSYATTAPPCAGSQGSLSPSFGQGASAGTFSAAPSGLTLNAQTGVITLATSQPGTYTVTNTIAAANGCAAATATASVTIRATPNPSVSANGPTTFCQGGSVVLTASGGTGNATYQWSTGANTPSITVSTSGQYSVTVTNGGCSGTSAATTVTVNPQASAAFSYGTANFCTSGQDPTPTLGGTPGGAFSATPAGLDLNNATGQITLAGSQPGTYTVTYAVGGQCPATQSQSVTISTAPSAAFSYPATGNRCAGTAGTLTPTFGTGAAAGAFMATPTGLVLNAATGVISLANSQPGTYSVTNTIAAANGCATAAVTVRVTINARPTASITAGGPTTFCAGGSVTLTASGGTSYLWSTGATTSSITVSASGQYSVTATNAAGCSATSQATTVTVNPQPSAAFAYATSTFCLSGQNPIPDITGATGGTFAGTPTGLALNTQTGEIALSNSQPGTYSVTYAVAGTCPASASQTVTITTAPSAAFSYPTTGLRCAGNPGTLAPTFGNGSSAGTFSASPAGLSLNAGSGVINLANSQAGTYTVTNTIAAANGCAASTATASVIINARPTASITAGGPTTFCQGGSVTLTASGGASYLWSTGATTASITVSTSGQYSVTATNAAGCAAASQATTVTVNPQPSAAFAYATSTYCLSGQDPTPTVSGSSGGTFSATPAGLNLNDQTGEIDLSASQPGTYTVIYALTGACPASATQTVTLTTAPRATFSYSPSASRCAGATGTLAPSFGTGAAAGTFSASPAGLSLNAGTGVISLATSQAGTYVVTNTIAAANGCAAATATASVTINARPTASISADGPTTFCVGGSVTLSASGGASYLWSTGATTSSITVSTSGPYSVTATNAAGCSTTSQATTVTVNPQPSAAFAYATSTYCLSGQDPTPTVSGSSGGSFSATPTGLNLNTQTGQIDLGASQPGAYTVTYALTGACPASATQTVTLTTAPAAAFSYPTTGTRCAGTAGTLTPSFGTGASAGSFSATPAGLSLNAGSGVINLANSQAGTYTVINTIAAANGCATSTATASVTINARPTAAISADGPTTFCAGDAVTLTASGGASYLWNTGATTASITVSTSGQYSVTATNAAGCSTTAQATTVTVNPQAAATFSYGAASYCVSGGTNPTPTVSGTTGGSFSATPVGLVLNAQTGQLTLAGSQPGTYTVTYAVAGACPASATQTVTITTTPAAAFSYPTTGTRCAGTAGTLAPSFGNGSSAGTFSASPAGLSLNAGSGVINLGNSQAGTYTVTNTIAAANGCAAALGSTTITINARPAAGIAAGGPTTFCQGGSVTLSASGGASYLWSTGATTASITVSTSGAYSVTATNVAGCSTTSQATTVTVNPQPSAAFAYATSTYCLSGQDPTPTVSGSSGGTFSATPAGLNLNAQTGQIDLDASQPGAYTVTYALTGACPASATQTVTLTTAPAAAFSYLTTGTRCAGTAGTLTPSFGTGASAGSFSATPAGLSLNAGSGVINLANSQAGTYTVTNTIAAANGCAAATATASVTINARPTAAISADGPTTFCAGDAVTLTASGGASYLWNTGATTASITVSTSGQYSVTATNAAGCSTTAQATTVTVNPQAAATFSYGAASYCVSGLDPTPNVTGTTGGTFSAAPAGLSLNAQTGQIDLGASQPGTYTVTYAVAGACPASATQTVTITTAPVAAFSYPTTGTRCAGTTGTLAPTFGNGASAGTFSATPVGLSVAATSGVINLTNSLPGTYTVTNALAAANGCAAVSATATLTINARPTATIAAGGPTTFCLGGSVTLTASGGTSYLWNTGATTASITVSASGAYSVTATNAAGCSATSQATTVTVTPQASAAFAYATSTYCLSGGQNPTPAISGAAGGTFSAAPAGLSIAATSGTINLGNSQPGTYTVTYAVGGACPAQQTQAITITTAPAAAFSYPTGGNHCAGSAGTLTPTLGTGASAGTFTATPAGLVLNAGTGAVNLATSQPGTYTVTNTIAASGACAASSATASVTIQAAPTATIAAGGATTFCAGGSVVLTASGGTSYLWSTGATTTSITVTVGGQYSVTATNAAGCSATSPVTAVTVNPQASAAFSYGAATYCVSGLDPAPIVTGTTGGTFSATPAGLNLAATSGQIDLSASQPGTYTVTYAVAGSCPASGSQTVTITAAPVAAFAYSTTAPACAGTTGTLTPTLGAGASAGTFSATPAGLALNPQTGIISLTSSAAGTYVVTNSVAAANGCAAATATASVTIRATPTATISANGPTTFCQGGSVTLTASGGTSYLWSTGATTSGITVSASGAYSVTATNAAGCSAASSATTVTVNAQPSAAFAYAGSTFCLSGQNPAPTIGGASGGTFSATPAGLGLNAQTGVINLGASQPGTYTVTYAVGGTCPAAQTQTVTISTAPAAAFSYPAGGTRCAGSAGTLAPTFGSGASAGVFSATPAGLSLTATSGVISLAASQPGTYVVTNSIGAANGCAAATATASVTINAVPAPTIAAGGPTTFCQGGSVTLTANGGTSYLWSTGATTASITVSAGGTYSVTATNAAGCSALSQATTVTVNPQPSATFAYAAPTYCVTGQNPTPNVTGTPGGTFSAVPGGLALTATSGAINLAASQPGTYTVTYTIGGPCPAVQTRTVTISTAPTAAFSYPTGGSTCAGTTGTLTPTLGTGASAGVFSATPAGLSLTATSGVINLATSQPGTYTVTNSLGAANGCAAATATASVTINAVPAPTIAAGGPTTFCAGGSVILTASGGTSYLWSTGATTASITVSTSGAYSVTATNAAGCSAASSATTVTVNPQASAAFAYAGSTFCISGQNPLPTVTGTTGGTFSATPAGLSLAATTGRITLAASQPGTYTVTYAVAGTCPAAQTQTVTITTAPSAAFSYPAGGSRCAGSAGTLAPTFGTGASAGTFTATPAGLSVNAASGVITLATSAAGTYTVTNAIGASGACAASSATATVTIVAAPTATIAAGGPTTFCTGGSVTLTAGGGASYLWSTGATTSSITVSTSGAYSVTATNAAGCSTTSQATTVTVNPQASAAFSYGAAGYCLGNATPVTPTIGGTPGGTFSATPAGLVLNAATGVVNLGTSAAGTYTITYAVAGPCPATQTRTLVLNAAPQGTFAYATSIGCAGTTGSLTPTLATGSTAGAFAAVPAGLALNAATGAINLATSQPGIYTVRNVVTGAGACATDTATTTITLLALPTVAISNLGVTYCTADGPTTLTGTVNGTPTPGTFTIDGVPATTFDPAALGAGPHVVAFTGNAGGACDATITATVTVIATPNQPTITLTPLGGGQIQLTSSQPTGNQWFLNGVPVPGATGPTYVVTSSAQNGDYTVVCTLNGCPSAPSAPQNVTILGVAAELPGTTLALFPNPTADGRVTLELTGFRQPVDLTLYDATGRAIYRATVPAATPRHELNLWWLSTGQYLLRAQSADGQYTVRRLMRE